MSVRTFPPIYRLSELASLPDPEWLIEGILPLEGLAVIFGAQGSGKSFVALDMALCIANAEAWQERDTVEGAVVYIAAEGSAGMKLRTGAWLAHRKLTDTRQPAITIAGAVPIVAELDATIAHIEATLAGARPRMIVIDTLQRCFVGNENDSGDMGAFVAACDALRLHFATTVLIVHHSGWEGSHERGSTVLPAAVDTRIMAERKGRRRGLLKCLKQKDGEEFGTAFFRLARVEESCVVEVTEWKAPGEEEPTPHEQAILDALNRAGGDESRSALRKATTGDGQIPEGSFNLRLKACLRKGLIEELDKHTYGLTELGREFVTPVLQRPVIVR